MEPGSPLVHRLGGPIPPNGKCPLALFGRAKRRNLWSFGGLPFRLTLCQHKVPQAGKFFPQTPRLTLTSFVKILYLMELA